MNRVTLFAVLTTLVMRLLAQEVSIEKLTIYNNMIYNKLDTTLFTGKLYGRVGLRQIDRFGDLSRLNTILYGQVYDSISSGYVEKCFYEQMNEADITGCVSNGKKEGYWIYQYVDTWVFKTKEYELQLKDSIDIEKYNVEVIDYWRYVGGQIKAILSFENDVLKNSLIFDRKGRLIGQNCNDL